MSVLDKFMGGFSDGDYDEDDYEEYEDADDYKKDSSRSSKNGSKVSNINRNKGRALNIKKPTSFDDSRDITDLLLDNKTVVLNLEGLDVGVSQRIIDFTSGATYAIEGNFQKVSKYIYVLTPKAVDVSGDYADGIAAAGVYDTASMRGSYQ